MKIKRDSTPNQKNHDRNKKECGIIIKTYLKVMWWISHTIGLWLKLKCRFVQFSFSILHSFFFFWTIQMVRKKKVMNFYLEGSRWFSLFSIYADSTFFRWWNIKCITLYLWFVLYYVKWVFSCFFFIRSFHIDWSLHKTIIDCVEYKLHQRFMHLIIIRMCVVIEDV